MIWALNTTIWLMAAVTISGSITPQRETIPEALARGSTGRIRTAPSGKPPTLVELLAETDVVVKGRVSQPRSYLSHDQRDVLTEYTIAEPVLVYPADPPTSTRPGILLDVTVTQLGGTVTIDGKEFTQKEEGLPPLIPGTYGVFLLVDTGDHYRIAGTFYGAFRIQGERLEPLTGKQGFAPELSDVPADEAIADMVAELRARQP